MSGVTSTFAYNGDGARLQQVVGGAVTTYTLDLAAPLVQVLVAHAPLAPTRYLYGMARIGEEQGSLWVYHLTDGLGSVRQLANASGMVTLARGYMPYGEAWWSEGDGSSDFGFAGEQFDFYIKLAYHRARWYDPALARWLTPDDIMPDLSMPRSLNPYAYAYENPVTYTDSDGHCPKPPSGSGSVICVDLFIQTEKIMGGFGYGDNRGWDYDSPPTKSRGYTYLYLDGYRRLTRQEVHVDNPSCTVVGCLGPFPAYNHFWVMQDLSTGTIGVDWELANGYSGALRSTADILRALNEATCHRLLAIGLGLGAGVIDGAGHAFVPDINGHMVLAFDPATSQFRIAELDRDPYPSLEIYYYDNGSYLYTVDRRPESPSGWPVIGLNPLAPRDHVP